MQLTDKDGNIFGTGGLEITTSTGKPKIPVINTDITIGTTTIVGGVAGRLLFDDAGVVGETNGVHWDKINSRLGLGTITPTQTLDIQGDISIGLSAATTVRAYYNSTTRNQLIYTNTSSLEFFQSINERMRLAPGSGNLLLNTTTDAGFRLDVNGTSRIQRTLDLGSVGYAGTINLRRAGDGGITSQITQTNDVTIIHNYQGSGTELKVDNVTYFHVRGFANQYAARVMGNLTAVSGLSTALIVNNAISASANNDTLIGLDIAPTFNNGAFTGLENIHIRSISSANATVVKNILLKNTGTGNGSGVSIGFNNLAANNLSHAFIKSYYVTPSGMAMSFGTGGGSSLTSEGTTALVLNADQTANFTARVIANSGGFQATGVSANLLMSDNGTPVITRNGSTGIQFLKDAYWQTFSIFTNNTENLRVASTGNVLINTTTDAGYKLDVNGNTRSSRFYATDGITLARISFEGFNNQIGIDYNSTSGLFKFFASGNNFLSAGWNLDTIIAPVRNSSGGNFGDVVINVGGSERARFKNTGNILINTTTDVASSQLTIESTTKGFLPPRMTTTQRNAIASPAAGLVVYDNTDNKHYGYNGTTWNAFY